MTVTTDGLEFVKMHGLGNDYVYMSGFDRRVADPAALARAVADRHFGIGSDGLILVLPPEPGVAADVRMRMFNADGSEAEMCGNGVRCVCKFAVERGLATTHPLRVQTGAGVLSLDYAADAAGRVNEVTVDMGPPELEPRRIPVEPEHLDGTDPRFTIAAEIDGHGASAFEVSFVSMGNPHAVIFTDRVAETDLEAIGPVLERHRAFPNRMNVHVVEVHDRTEVTMRTWERGSGITLACGTGACAVCVAGVRTGRTGRLIRAHLPGGDLDLRWDEASGHVFMRGPAVEVFHGTWQATEPGPVV